MNTERLNSSRITSAENTAFYNAIGKSGIDIATDICEITTTIKTKEDYSIDDIRSKIKQVVNSLDDEVGVTFSGGDPFEQAEACANLAKYIHSIKRMVLYWLYL